jgi:thioredoxin reductase/NAD-dependent dihydropyrimidine dehydrogenase PreA subunit
MGEFGADALLSCMIYGIPLASALALHSRRRRRVERESQEVLARSRAAGLTEPVSLHPVVNPRRCFGCGACVRACPEGDVLGLVDGQSAVVNPANCIGHGECQRACPTEAITLVLGTGSRGVDVPVVGPDLQTNVPGLFVAGELGGMGLIRNAVEQGVRAVAGVRGLDGIGKGRRLDVLVVGAGPAGLAACLAAKAHGLRCIALEQESPGGAVAHYPRGKIVMTSPVELPIFGRLGMRETTKEALLGVWDRVIRETGIEVRHGERVEAIARGSGGFEVGTSRASYATRAVVLAIGRRGTPRKLGVPGEDSSKVVYRLVDAQQYEGRRVLVVGGGDSALEAAAALADQAGTEATLVHRRDAFSGVRPRNRDAVAAAASAGRLRVLLRAEVSEILPGSVRLRTGRGPVEIGNDAVIVCAGGVLPGAFLRSLGVEIETKRGSPL